MAEQPQLTEIEQLKLQGIRVTRELMRERISGSNNALQLLDIQETEIMDAINARERAAAVPAEPGDALPRGLAIVGEAN